MYYECVVFADIAWHVDLGANLLLQESSMSIVGETGCYK
jgi:hypothetical protein